MIEMNQNAALRMAGAYALESLNAAKQDFDFLDALILTSVEQANLEPLYRDAARKMEFASHDDCPPDAMRRPISINALAMSMGLPFETVRRRIVGLTGNGLISVDRHGVYVPAVSEAKDHVALADSYDRLEGLHARLDAAGWPSPTNAQPRLWTGHAPTRLAARVSTEFTLRLIRALTTIVGDPLAVAIWLAILCSDGSGEASGPVRISEIARRLQLPSETARRRVQALASRGLCGLSENGAVVNAAQLETVAFAQLAQRNLNDLRRMFAQLGDLGVVNAWRVAAQGAAALPMVARAA